MMDFYIKSEAEHDAVGCEVERLFDAPFGSAEAIRFANIAAVVEAYEQEHYAIGAPSEAATRQYHEEKMLVAA